MMPARSSIADGFSILTMIAAGPSARRRTSSTSSPRCTNESAIQSTPRSTAQARSASSFSVSGPIGSSVSGRLMPLRLPSAPPFTTSAAMQSRVASMTRMRILPSSSSSVCPGATPAKICG